MKRIYLDNAAGTPIDAGVLKKMMPFLKENFGNPSSLYKEGVWASTAVASARESIAKSVGVLPSEIIFTGSGTESDNLAILGTVSAFLSKRAKGVKTKPHIITGSVEHMAVLGVIEELEKKGIVEATYISVDAKGAVSLEELKSALKENTVLVSIMYANSEVGTIQPIRDVAKIVKKYRELKKTNYPYVHTDACQAMNYLDTRVESLGVDLMTFNGSKIYGPKGVGILVSKHYVDIDPIVFGGGQEKGMRSGTENVAGIVGTAAALEIAEKMKKGEVKRLTSLRDHFMKKLEKTIPNVTINGDRIDRLPNNVHITIPNIEDDVLVIALDAKGVACSSKSACKMAVGGESHVIKAMKGKAEGSHLRFTLGRSTTKKDIDYTVAVLGKILEKYKNI
jgi:cysteine desulfurase